MSKGSKRRGRVLPTASEKHQPWMSEGICYDHENPDLWFPKRSRSKEARKATALCMECPVRQQCLDYAEANQEPFGIWGGKNFEWHRIHGLTGRQSA